MVERISFSPAVDELEKIKRLQLPHVADKAPAFVDAFKSSISPSSLEEVTHFRPQLPQPMLRLLACQTTACTQSTGWLGELSASFEKISERLDELRIQITKAVEEGLSSLRLERKYHAWETLLQYGAAASSVAWGAALVASGVDLGAGWALIVAGGLGLINQVMTDTGWWGSLVSYCTESRETQKIIESRIQTGLFLTSMGCAVLSGRLALNADALNLAPILRKNPLRVFSIFNAFVTGGLRWQKGAIQKRSCDIQKKMILLSEEDTRLQKMTTEQSSYFREDQTALQHALSAVRRAVEHLFTSA